MEKELLKRIAINPKIMTGKPVIKGTRIPVVLVLAELANGTKAKELAKGYRITERQILTALRYAQTTVANEEIVTI
mgnify:CR=1 FL=1